MGDNSVAASPVVTVKSKDASEKQSEKVNLALPKASELTAPEPSPFNDGGTTRANADPKLTAN